MLQNRVNELNTAILDIKENKAYILGFMNEEMIQLYLTKGSKNWSSMGQYDHKNLEFHNIKDNALFIVKKDGVETTRYQYKPLFRDTFQFKDEEGKTFSLTINIRKSQYSHEYHLLTTRESILFNNKEELDRHLYEHYRVNYSY